MLTAHHQHMITVHTDVSTIDHYASRASKAQALSLNHRNSTTCHRNTLNVNISSPINTTGSAQGRHRVTCTTYTRLAKSQSSSSQSVIAMSPHVRKCHSNGRIKSQSHSALHNCALSSLVLSARNYLKHESLTQVHSLTTTSNTLSHSNYKRANKFH